MDIVDFDFHQWKFEIICQGAWTLQDTGECSGKPVDIL